MGELVATSRTRADATTFGDAKYAAFNLMVARWLSRNQAIAAEHNYVTVAGSQLHDVLNLAWINGRLARRVVAYEQDTNRWKKADQRARSLGDLGVQIDVLRDDYFTYERDSDAPHIFYIDVPGVISNSHHGEQLKSWFVQGVIQPGDLLLITSSLRVGSDWKTAVEPFEGEFMFLGIRDDERRKELFELAHPGLVLLRALRRSGRDAEVRLDALGSIRYVSRTVAMGLYGFECLEGRTELSELVEGGRSYFDMVRRIWGVAKPNAA